MFTGNEDHSITLAEAAVLTEAYRAKMNSGDRKGGFFGREAILEILNQQNCVGIRYYYGLDDQSKQVLVLVGATTDENDMTAGILAEQSVPCPSRCGDDNELNS